MRTVVGPEFVSEFYALSSLPSNRRAAPAAAPRRVQRNVSKFISTETRTFAAIGARGYVDISSFRASMAMEMANVELVFLYFAQHFPISCLCLRNRCASQRRGGPNPTSVLPD